MDASVVEGGKAIMLSWRTREDNRCSDWEGASQTVTEGGTERRREGERGRVEGSQREAGKRWKE